MMEQVEHVEQALRIPLNEMGLQCLQQLHGIDEMPTQSLARSFR